ncbi:MAG: hypothetical protein ABIW82_09365 [Dokdonella sp.]
MPLRSARTIASLFSVSLLAASSFAGAQVTLNLTTPQQTNCTAVTDAQGLHLAAGGSNLIGTGVTLSGTGCGAVSDNYAVVVQTPATAVSGTAFNVAWSASAQATQCLYTGTPGAAGWPVGTSACSGAACSGNHNVSVTIPAAGQYTFGMFCSNASGSASGQQTTATAPPLAPQPANFALTVAPASPVLVNTPFNVSWVVSGAATCTATADLNGTPTTLGGWTNVGTSPTPPRVVTPTAAGTYTLKLTCTNAAGSTLSAPATVVAQVVNGDNCILPASRQLLGTLCYTYAISGSSCSPSTDVTKFETIWGRNAPAGTPVLFPGLNYYNVIANMGATTYISAKFVMPTSLPSNSSGILAHGGTLPGPNLTMAISDTCGDFAPANTQCGPTADVPGGAGMGKWKLSTYATNGCPLVAGQTYFINLKVTDPAACGAGTACEISTQNNHTP